MKDNDVARVTPKKPYLEYRLKARNNLTKVSKENPPSSPPAAIS